MPEFFFDSGLGIGDEATNAIPSSSPYLCGVLNSRLLRFVLKQAGLPEQNEQKCTWDVVRHLPIRTPDFDRPEELSRHEKMEQLVLRILELEKNCLSADRIDGGEGFQRKVRATEVKINSLVYELYGLTPEEIAVVEETVGRNNFPS
jgi:hypothetical protein